MRAIKLATLHNIERVEEITRKELPALMAKKASINEGLAHLKDVLVGNYPEDLVAVFEPTLTSIAQQND